MKKIFYIIIALSFFVQLTFAQKVETTSAGPIPKIKTYNPPTVGNKSDNPAWLAFGHSSIDNYTVSFQLPAGTPFTQLFNWAPSTFASSMAANPQGLYYITETGPPAKLHQMTGFGEVTPVGEIIGMGTEQPNGIAYNWVNSSFYIASGTNLYSFDPINLNATLIGPFNTGGNIIDLCFNEYGVCFAYDIVTDCGYTINISTGEASLLGPLGYSANYGQGMSYDIETQTIYLSAFNGSTFTGQLRTMNPQTGMTTLITDWGFNQLAPFAVAVSTPPPCPVGLPENPNPPNGATNIPITGNVVSWTNGVGTLDVELWFGPTGNIVKLYDGPAITSFGLPTLNYSTLYRWYVICKNEICGTQGSTWSFTTEDDPHLIYETIDVYPLNVNYWTGTCNSSVKTEVSLVNAISTELGWMVFDVSPIINNAQIFEVEFHGYLYVNNWPYWSITPMGGINAVTASASAIYNQVSTHYGQGIAYSYNEEPGTLTNGWITRALENGAENDMENALLLNNYFTIGIVDFDFSSSYYVGFQGWIEANRPFLRVKYEYCLSFPVLPSNLTAQVIYISGLQVQLNWQDNSSNESGFRIYRKYGYPNDPGNYELVGTVQQDTTQYLDELVTLDSTYTYIVFAFNGCGPSIESNTATITVSIPVGMEEILNDELPKEFSLNQNYPNPFNPSTKIKYTIPSVGTRDRVSVQLKVYDVLGNEVATLVNEEKSSGSYEVEFDGSSLTSGIYFYQLQLGDFIQTKKMILMK